MKLRLQIKIILLLASMLAFTACRTSMVRPESSLAAGNGHYYDTRPKIEDLAATKHALGGDWSNFKRSMVETLAMFYGMYPQSDLYFLARDAEYLYDLSRVLVPPKGTKVILTNISTTLSQNSNGSKGLLDYLGLNEKRIEAVAAKGGKIVFVDSGFAGSIPTRLRALYSNKAQPHLKGHLLASSGTAYPSTKVFHAPFTNVSLTNHGTGTAGSFEGLTHFTNSGTNFINNGKKWDVAATAASAQEQANAKAMMEDLKHYAGTKDVQEVWKTRTAQWKTIGELFHANKKAELTDYLETLIGSKGPGAHHLRYMQAMVLDVLELANTNFKQAVSPNVINGIALTPPPKPIPKLIDYVGKKLKKGETYKGVGSYTIEAKLGETAEFLIYEAVDSSGNTVILRLAKKASKKIKESIANSAEGLKTIGEVSGVKVAEFVEHSEIHSVQEVDPKLETVADWLLSNKNGKIDTKSDQYEQLRKIIKRPYRKGYLVHELSPRDMVWDGKRWVIIAADTVEKGLTPKKARHAIHKQIGNEWAILIADTDPKLAKLANSVCAALSAELF